MSIAIAGSLLACAARAGARQLDVIVGGAISPPNLSDYRSSGTALGYDTRSTTLMYEIEASAQLGVAFDGWLTVGPLLRASLGRLGAPYDGVQPITTDALFFGVRAEAAVFDWPRLFFWADVAGGRGWIGQPNAYESVGAWALRGGIGMRMGKDAGGVRMRFGYGVAPTFSPVTPTTGKFDYGGFVIALDGVIRVLG